MGECAPQLYEGILGLRGDNILWIMRIWFDLDSSLGHIGSIVPVIDIHDLHLTVKDVFSSNDPHSQVLYTQLPPPASDSINNLNVKFNPSLDDAFIWASNKSGAYTTKSGYA